MKNLRTNSSHRKTTSRNGIKRTTISKKLIQSEMLPRKSTAYGGDLRNTRKGREGSRVLSTRNTMHIVLRSSKAKGAWSFQAPKNKNRIQQIIAKHANRNCIQILSVANVGNHLHMHIKLPNNSLTIARNAYMKFIRAITGAIALCVMGANKNATKVFNYADRFWDYRPFSKIVSSIRHFLNMQDYMKINALEGLGIHRINARLWIARQKDLVRYGPWPDLAT